MLNSTFLSSKFKLGIVAFFLLISNALSAQTYDANQKRVSFGGSGVTISYKVGTNGKTVGDLVLYENVITIGGQKIDALVKNVSLTNVKTFTEFDATTSSSASGQNDSFFSPQFDFNGAGSWKFNITFIKNGTYNATTKTGTAVNLINVVLNTYDIDGNGGTGTNQYNEFGDLKRYELGSGTNITASYNSTTGLTKFRSNVNTNSTTILADAHRVRVYFDTLSSIDFVVGADGGGLAYFFLDFSVGPTFSTACNLALTTDNATNPSCAGTSTGSISLTTSGGTTPYTYSWSGPSNTKTTEDVTAIPAGAHTITVTDNNSCKQVKTITLTDPAAPTITGSAAVCTGNTITLTGSGTANSSSPWSSSSTSVATVSSTGIVTGITAGSTTITYKNSAGCTATKAITVNAAPNAAVSPTSATVNFKTAQSITATPSTGVTYSWTPATGLSSTTTATVTATAAVDTRYLVTITSTTNGCTDTASCFIKINVFDLANSCPTITKKNNGTTKGSKYVWGFNAKTLSYSVASGSLEMQFAAGTPAANIPKVKAIYTNGVLDNSVDFDHPMTDMTNGYDSTFPSNAKIYYNFYSTSKSGNLGNGNIVTIEFTDSIAASRAGRKEQTRMCSYDLSGGTPAAIPAPTITTNLANTYSDCKGATRTLSIKATLGTAANSLSYQWYKNNVALSSRTKDTLILANVQTTYSGDYYCIVKETNTSSVVVASLKSNIATYTVSAPTVAVSPTSATINVGSSQALTASGALTYAWSPSTGLSATTGTTVTASPTATTTYTVTGTDASGCTNTASSVITVNTPLTGGKIAGSQSVCSGGDPTAFTSTTAASGGTGTITYQWQQSINSGTTFTDITSANSATYDVAAGITATTLYRRKATDAASTIKYSDTVTVAVNALPTISGTASACIGATTTLTGSGTAATSSPWLSATTSVATVSSSGVVTGVAAGTSVITYTNSNGCSATQTVTINALPTISGTAEVCVGSTTTLTGSGTAASSSPWTTSNSAVASITSAGVMTGASAGTATITYTNNNGCSVTTNAIVNSLPTITGSTSVCQFGTLSLTGSGTAASSNPWTSSNTTIATVSNTGSVFGVGSGNVTISYTNNKGCTETQIITVNGQPSVSVSPSSATISPGGSQSLTASGANSYAWSPSATLSSSTGSSVTATPSTTTTYDVIGTDSKGCKDTTQVTVTVLSSLSAGSISGSQTICYGADPTAFTNTTSASGGTGSLTIQWQKSINSGSTWSDISGATSATFDESSSIAITTSYRRKVTDGASNIDYSNTITISVNSKPNISLSESNVSCKGGSNGSITTTISGGTSAFTYSWSGSSYSATTKNISSLVAGTYTLICTDNNSCKDTASATITEPSAALSIGSPTITNVGCKGASTGAVSLTVSGGTTAYSYAWSGPGSYSATTKDISSLAAGTYSVTVTDANGCSASNTSVSVTEPAAVLSVSNSSQTNVLCYGNSTGAVTVAAAGGTSPYEYKIGTGAYSSTATFSSLAAGSYTITAKDANGCTETLSVTITQPSAALSIASPTITNVGCKGASTGAVSLSVSGGTTAYSYAWSGPGSYSATTKDISSLAAGTYSVTVTDANGCSASNTSVSVTEPAAVLSVSNSSQTNVLCYGNSTGAVTVAAAGGTSPYEYKIGTGAYSSTATFSSLAAGSYTITAKDANGCTSTLSVTITQPSAALSIASPTITNVGCKGASTGSVSLTVSGGTTAYSYAWSGPSSYSATTKDISSLAAGTYSVTVTDANGCSASNTSVSVTEPAAVLSVSNSSQTNVLCYGNSTGAVTVAAAGGTSPYEYKIGTGVYSSTATFSSLAAGSYTITAKDANGCTETLSVTITQPSAAISVTAITSTNISCNGGNDGTITITATGGTTKKYSIDNGTTFQSSNDFTGLTAGSYTIVVSDNNNCSATLASGVSASVTLTEPNAISVTAVASTNISCNGGNDGTITITATGGTTKKYSIDNGATFQSSNVFTGLTAGSYTIVVSDNNNCSGLFASGVSASVTLTQPNAISVTAVTSTNISCNGGNDGTITITATGGTTKKYSIDNGTTFQSSNVFTGLTAGSYTIVVSDNNNCTGSFASGVSASVTLTEPNAISVTAITSTNISCNGGNDGTITITATGGTTKKYSIDNGTTFQSSNVFTGLTAGSYTIVVSDNNNCSATLASGVSASVTLTEPNAISVTAVVSTNISCNGGNDGTITITATGGTTKKYSIDNGATFQSSNVFTGLTAGSYTIVVSDNNNCSGSFASGVSASVTLTQPNAISVTAVTSTNISCNGGNDGTITITATGGTTKKYSIDNGATFQSSNVFTGLTAGSYTIVVSDNNNCSGSFASGVSASVTLTQPNAISVTAVTSTNPSCKTATDGTITITATGGNTLSYSIDNGTTYQSSNIFTGLGIGTYTVKVQDSKSCSINYGSVNTTITLTNGDITKPTVLTKNYDAYLNSSGAITISYSNVNNGSFDNCEINAIYLDDSTFDCTNIGPNTVTLTVSDIAGNTDTKMATVTVYDTISPAPKAKDLVVYLDATGNVSITAAQANNASTDNCSIKSLSLSKSNFSCADTGVNNSIKFTATDYSNNTAYTFFNVRVRDTISPTPKAKNLVVYLDATGNVSITAAQANNASTDNCSIKTLSLSKSNFSCADTGVNNSIKFTATDYSNNTAYTFFNVRVRDTISPTPKAKNLVVYLDATGNVSITAAQANNASTDNCSIKSLSLSKSNFSCADTGVNNSIKFTATDYSNNTAYTFFNVRVRDTISPTPKAKNLVVYLDATGNVSITAAQANNASTDNCSIKSLSLSKSNFSCADTGVNNSIKFTATDYSNNTAYSFFNVRVYDTISPTPKAKNLVVYLDATGNVSITAAQANNASTDNCSIKTLSLSKSNFSCADTGVNNSIKFTATDYSNNTAYTFFNVRVYDTISPTPKAKNLVVYLDATGNVSITAAQANNASTDNCSIKTLSLSKSNFSCADTGVNKGIVFTATDYSNNSASTTFNVTVLDTIKPTITVKTAVVYLDTAARASLTRAMFTVSTSDNCGVIDTTLSRYLVTLSDTGWNDIDVWVTDKSKNVTGPIRTKVLVLIADSDNDSIPDYIEGSKDYDGDGVYDYVDLDSDNDGVLDVVENEGKDSLLDWDADGKPNYKDLDTDGDGIDDVVEVSGNDPDFDGIAGTGKAVVDTKGIPTIASGGYKEVFTDSDLQPDYKDLDADDDGIIDAIEKGATNNPVDTDGDGTGDWRDLDADNDGISDKTETDVDTDGDGTGDWRDLDTDNDGIADKIETTVDTDGDGTGDWRDLDSDNDGISDKIETDIDTDGDGTGDWRDLDTDNDGISDKIETDIDTDGDGQGDWRDLDTDNDGISDKIETDIDTDGDGKGDWRDLDSDNDQIPDKVETDVDTDGDGIGDWRDLDSDNDTLPDTKEAGDDPNNPTDTDGDGTADFRELDSDNDELPDNLEGLQDSKIPNIWIPEGISPNGDGINDLLYIKGLANFKNSSVLIFNRWGQIVYESGLGYTNANGFDGYYHGKGLAINTDQPLPENVYFLVFKSNDDKGLIIKQNLYIKAN